MQKNQILHIFSANKCTAGTRSAPKATLRVQHVHQQRILQNRVCKKGAQCTEIAHLGFMKYTARTMYILSALTGVLCMCIVDCKYTDRCTVRAVYTARPHTIDIFTYSVHVHHIRYCKNMRQFTTGARGTKARWSTGASRAPGVQYACMGCVILYYCATLLHLLCSYSTQCSTAYVRGVHIGNV